MIQFKLACVRTIIILLFALVCTLQLSHADTLYKSVDSQGRVTYSDKPTAHSKPQKTLVIKNGPSTPLPPSFANKIATKKISIKANSKQYSGAVTLFSADWCGYCKQAKSYLNQHGIQYDEMDIDTEQGKQNYFEAGGSSGVPLLVANNQKIQGFSKASYDAVFIQPE